MTAYLEQQLTEGVGARVGFVYYTVKNQTGTFQPLRPASAYTVPFNVVDPGLDGITGTADDQNLTAFGIPTGDRRRRSRPTNVGRQNSQDNGAYKTIEFSLNKRQSHNYSLGVGARLHAGSTTSRTAIPNTPNGPYDYDFSTYSAKANGTYTTPKWGILLSAVYRYQAGLNYARRVSVSTPASCACTFSAAAGGPGSLATGSLTATTSSRRRSTPSVRTTSRSSISASRRRCRWAARSRSVCSSTASTC